MPKNPLKSFVRRKSSGNVLDLAPENGPAPVQSSFRVIERPEKRVSHNFSADARVQGRVSPARPFGSPLHQLRGKSADDLGLGTNRLVQGVYAQHVGEALKHSRGSAGTTNSGSSGYYESSAASARHSSSSTLPSSVDAEREHVEEELFPKKAENTLTLQSFANKQDEPLPPPPSFTSRAARAFSFGQKSNRSSISFKPATTLPPQAVNGASRSPERQVSPQRERGMTTSSYASTAVPSKSEANLNLGETRFDDTDDDFGNIFANIGKSAKQSQESLPLRAPPAVGGFHRAVRNPKKSLLFQTDLLQDSEPMFPPRAYNRQTLTPSPPKHSKNPSTLR